MKKSRMIAFTMVICSAALISCSIRGGAPAGCGCSGGSCGSQAQSSLAPGSGPWSRERPALSAVSPTGSAFDTSTVRGAHAPPKY